MSVPAIGKGTGSENFSTKWGNIQLPPEKIFRQWKMIRQVFCALLLVSMSLGLAGFVMPQPRQVIRVGIYENPPKIFTAEDGTASGFWPDLLNTIARNNGWDIIWVHGTWEECLERLEANEIDLMPDVGWTPERAKDFAFSKESVLTSWARIYTYGDLGIETILDLDGKKIAGLKGSLNFDGPEGIKVLAAQFNVTPIFVAKNNYTEVFESLKNGEVDAGMANKDFGDTYEKDYGLTRTPIIIQPTQLVFALTKDAEKTPYLISIIDTEISTMKADENSVFYESMDKYFGGISGKTIIEIIPQWVMNLFMVSGGIILFLLAVSLTTREQVRRQTVELRGSEARNRALLENYPDIIFRISKEGIFLDYHAVEEGKLLTSPEEFMGKNVADVLPADLAQATMSNVNSALRTNNLQVQEFEFPLKDGVKDFEARYTASGDGEVIAIVRDITARKRAEKELRESEERYHNLARVSPDGIFRTDPHGQTIYVNPTWCRISGLQADEAMGDGWLKAVHPDDRIGLQENWEKSANLHIPSQADYRFILPDGSITWVIGQAMPEINADNEVVGYVGTITDITERKNVEAALQRSIMAEREALKTKETIQAANLALSHSLDLDEVLQMLLDYLNQIVPYDKGSVLLLEDDSHLTINASRGYQRLDGKSLDQSIREDISKNPAIIAVIDDHQSLSIEDTDIYPSWKFLPVLDHGRSWLGVPLIAGGQILGLFSLEKNTPGFFTQEYRVLAESLAAQAAVTLQNAKLHRQLREYASELELRVAQRTSELANRVNEVESLNQSMQVLNEDLRQAVKRAEHSDRLKSAFLATMSHELRTPLNSIIGFTGILLQKMVGPLSAEQEKQLGMVQKSARHLLELINDVLDISKIEADEIVLNTETFDVILSMRSSVEKILPPAKNKGLVILTEFPPHPVELVSDRRRFEQVLINLLNNAVKFTNSGEVCLTAVVNDNFLVTSVRDTGIGIKPEDIPSLFKPFQQVDTGLTRQYEGTGLGLSISKRLVELLGGSITVQSQQGEGSTFSFTLPINGAAREEDIDH
jgi:PAS domain S-box-containing protein